MSVSTTTNQAVRPNASDFAVNYLVNEGYKISERDWKCEAGVADIIACEEGTLVFVEVKSRRSILEGFPEEAVTKAKHRQFEIIAALYLSQDHQPSMRVRFDKISIVLTGSNQAFLKHYRDVFA